MKENKNLPIYNSLVDYKKKFRSSFHTPGHKNNFFSKFEDLFELDFTEIKDTDDLYNPRGCIFLAQDLAKRYFKTQATVFSAGGNTLCIQAMLKLSTKVNDKIICSRNLHKSALYAIILLGLKPIWVFPKGDNLNRIFINQITAQDIKKSLEKNKDAKAVYVTSPDYYGNMCDIRAISKECKLLNIPLLVDNAHGTHLRCLNPNIHPINLGADFCADSAHKTTPTLTGGAFLHVNNLSFCSVSPLEAMSVFGSTSPSFPILASLDLCRDWMQKKGKEAFFDLIKKVELIKSISKNHGIFVQDGLVDPTRISLGTPNIGYTPKESAVFFRRYGVEPEFESDFFLVLIASAFNTNEDFCRLERAILNLKIKQPLKIKIPKIVQYRQDVLPREAFFSSSKRVPIKQSLNMIVAQCVCPCPPGVPLVIPGEKINETTINLLQSYGVLEILVLK